MSVLLAALAGVTGAIAAYLLALTGAALLARRTPPAIGPGRRRFAICIPAHNEEAHLGRLLESVGGLDYARDLVDAHVVADNCTDATATVARAGGGTAHERTDAILQGKGQALRWLLDRLQEAPLRYDAFVVVDADSVLDSNFLRAMDSRLEAGAEVIQAHYGVLNPGASALSSLRTSALAAIHYVRPLGRAALGLSAGLKGNGMCFSAGLMRRVGWRWFSLAEDVEFHLALVEIGVRVDFAPETRVLADMPVTFAQAQSQNVRWERGRLYVLRTQVPRLIVQGLRLRSGVRLDAAVEQLIPPLSVPLSAAFVAVGGGLALELPIVTAAGLASVGAYGLHILAAMALTRAPARAYAAFALAPPYVLWKLVLYLRAMTSTRVTEWVRTSRSS